MRETKSLKIKNLTLSSQFLLILLGLTLLTTLSIGGAFYFKMEQISKLVANIIDKDQESIWDNKLAAIIDSMDREWKSISTVINDNGLKGTELEKDFMREGQEKYLKSLDLQGKLPGTYYFILDKSGRIVAHPNLKKGEDLSGQDFAKRIASEGNGSFQYNFFGEDKWMIFRTCEAWSWIVGYCMPMKLKHEDVAKTQGIIKSAYEGFFMTTASLVLLAALAALLFTRAISKPLSKIVEHAAQVAKGDLTQRMDQKPRNYETGALMHSINAMTERLGSLVGQVQGLSGQVVSSIMEIAASSKQQEASVSEFGSTTTEIAASTTEISATSQHLVKSMDDVSEVAKQTAELAEQGQANLDRMQASMNLLATATTAISSRLSAINEKANKINNVVVTITKVADQTNLLSLNASIEAEKAGEYGKGFSVVAREISRLADQTAVATLDITEMVKEMHAAVSSGVMEMDKFSESVRHGVKETESINAQLEKIMAAIQSLPPVFSNISEGMKQQAAGAQQINNAIMQLSDSASQTVESTREFNEAIALLNSASLKLQEEVSVFKVKG